MTMDSAYGLRLGLPGLIKHHHYLQHQHCFRTAFDESSIAHMQSIQPQQHHHHVMNMIAVQEEPTLDRADDSSLRFSVVNILRPDFGRNAILTRSSTVHGRSIPLPKSSPLPLPPDLSISRLSPPEFEHSNTGYSTVHHRDRDKDRGAFLRSPSLSRHDSGLSRSGSVDSLASGRSSVTGSSVTGGGAPSLCSSSSSIGNNGSNESVNGDNNTSNNSNCQNGSNANGQPPWPAWVYCTRYSDRPSSGKLSVFCE